MFAPEVIAQRRAQLAADPTYGSVLPEGLQAYPVADVQWFVKRLGNVLDAKGQPTRSLTREEDTFIANERLLTRIDFKYWAERYVWIDKDAAGLAPLYPLWGSQEIILRELGRLELRHAQIHSPEGVLVNILKARQLGASSLAQAILAHRVLTAPHVKALTGADVDEQAGHLFSMLERIADHLPWFLAPTRLTRVKNRELSWSNHSIVKTAWGKSMRGGLQDEGSVKGNIGRGKTFSAVHISELSTWERPDQLDDGLMPGIPYAPRTFVAFESTAKGRHNWWHAHWLKTERGLGRFHNIFIPWYAERSKYWLPPPGDWTPLDTTLAHAARATDQGPRWLGGPVQLDPAQLFWYEQTRRSYEADERRGLAKFLEEYAADPEECFQHTGKPIFSLATIERTRNLAATRGGLRDVLLVQPLKTIVQSGVRA